MNNIIQIKAIAKKEIYAMMKSPVLYIAFLIFHLTLAIPFIGFNFWFNANISDLNFFFMNIPFAFILIIPLLTVGRWSDEYKYETDKILFNFPASEYTLIIGKFMAPAIVFIIILLCSMLIPISIFRIGYFYLPSFFISYIYTLFFGLACISISLAVSCISIHGGICFILSLLTIIFFSFIHILPKALNLPKVLIDTIRLISFQVHFETASHGVFNIKDFIFYFALIILGIEFNALILKSKREKR
ncbi:MAG: hypothetical protein CR988_04105 [Treponema sp.]|nr:MAG: hypothetical protein CR988_04105 [Treponema sp.]